MNNKTLLAVLFSTTLSCLSFNSLAIHEPRDESAGDPPKYEVNCPKGATDASTCKVDKGTYIGWRTFSTTCQVCHGGSGMGSTFAPNLMERFNKEGVDYPRFKYAVTHGYHGHVGAMPAWDKNPQVMKNLDNLYRYLKARADDTLPEGRPARMKN
jgi:mono/diheme cytochrome c family protein